MNLEDEQAKWIIFSFSTRGMKVARDIESILNDKQMDVQIYDKLIHENIHQLLAKGFCSGNVILFIGAVGIAVRCIAPYIKDKLVDPAVIVIDDHGEFVIPILSGHIGGANKVAKSLSDLLNGHGYASTPVVTTATDQRGVKGIEEVFQRFGVPYAPHRALMKRLNMHLVEGGALEICIDPYLGMTDTIVLKIGDTTSPSDHISLADSHNIDNTIRLIITLREPYRWLNADLLDTTYQETIVLESQSLILGTGSKKALAYENYYQSLVEALNQEGFLAGCIKKITSIDLKKEEKCICSLANALNIEFEVQHVEALLPYESLFSISDFVKNQVGVGSVAGTSAYALTQDVLAMQVYKKEGCTFSIGRLIR